MDNIKYTIIGGGIAGLTTALMLEHIGTDYQVYEKAPILNEVGAGIWLSANALQVYEELNLLASVKSKGNSIDRITLGLPDLSPLSDTNMDQVKKAFGFSTIAIHRARLQKLLLESLPKEKILLGKDFSSFEKTDAGKVKINFSDNSSTVSDFLIGADGIHSGVRKQLFPESKIRYSGQTCWRGVADIHLNPEFNHRGLELWGDQVRFGLSKIADGKVYWFAVALNRPNGKDLTHQVKEKLLVMFSSFHPMIQTIIKSTDQSKILRNDIIDLRPLKKWHQGPIGLIGDAGHATTPNMGQGGAQAIEDAYYLGKLIQKNPDRNIFESFQQLRRKKVDTVVKQSWQTGKMAHWKFGKPIRNFMLKSIPKKFLQKKLMALYRLDK